MAREVETKTQLRATVAYLQNQLSDYKKINRQLPRDLTDLKTEIAKLRMENNRLKAEVDKCRRAE